MNKFLPRKEIRERIVGGIAMLALLAWVLNFPQALTYTFTQNAWNTVSPIAASHPANQTGWTQYESADSGIQGGSDIRLTSRTETKTYTTQAQFMQTVGATPVFTSTAIVGDTATSSNLRLTHQAIDPLNVVKKIIGASTNPNGTNNVVLHLDSKDNPHVVFAEDDTSSTNWYESYTRNVGSGWPTPYRFKNDGVALLNTPGFAIEGVQDILHAFITNPTGTVVQEYRCTTLSNCMTSFPVVSTPAANIAPDTFSGFVNNEAVYDANNNGHLIYSNANTNRTYYVHYYASTNTWSTPLIIFGTSGTSGNSLSNYIQLDSNNHPRIFIMREGTNVEDGDLYLVWCNLDDCSSSGWNGAQIDDFSSDIVHAIGFKADGNYLHFTYWINNLAAGASNTIRYKRCPNPAGSTMSGCTTYVDATGNGPIDDSATTHGRYSDIAIDSLGKPHIAYSSNTNNSLYYARCTTLNASNFCSAWAPSIQLDAATPDDTIELELDGSDNPHLINAYGNATDISYMTMRYNTSGSYTSGVIEPKPGIAPTWNNFSWTATVPTSNGAAMQLRIRSANNTAMTLHADGSGVVPIDSCFTQPITGNGSVAPSAFGSCIQNGDRYIQYKLIYTGVNTATDAYSPIFEDFNANYTYTANTGTLISSPYNTSDISSALSKISWVEQLPAGSFALLQMRTASTQAGLASATWSGPTAGGPDPTSYFSSLGCPTSLVAGGTLVTCDLPAIFSQGDNDQWFQYKVYLLTFSVSIPIVDDVSVQYVINTSPAVTVTAASQDTVGVVTTTYTVSDPEESSTNISLLYDVGMALSSDPTASCSDTAGITLTTSAALLPASGTIQINSEQITYSSRSLTTLNGITRCANNTRPGDHVPGDNVWFRAETVAGNVGPLTPNGSGRTITWTPTADIPGVYRANARMRVTSNDGQPAHQVGFGDSATFVFDAKDPAVGDLDPGLAGNQPIIIDSLAPKTSNAGGNVTLTLSVTDDTSLQMILSNDGVFDSETYEAYSSSRSWLLTAGDAVKTVYAKFKDAKGNEVGPFSDSIILDRGAPNTPIGLNAAEVSNQLTGDVRFIVSWGVLNPAPTDTSGAGDFRRYNLMRSVSGGAFTVVTQITDINTNAYIDNVCITICIGQQVQYKITAEDDIGNTSAESTPITLTPTGTTPDITAPSITSISPGSSGVNYQPISWYASESPSSDKSDSSVLYTSTIPAHGERDFTDTTPKILNTTLIGNGLEHLVYMIGLTPSQSYSYQVRSRDQSGNVGKATTTPGTFQFPLVDTAPPNISGLSVTPTVASAIFSWNTDEPATALVEYGAGKYGDHRFSTSHTVVLPATLTAGTPYSFTIRSRDVHGNEANQSGSFTTFAGTDNTPPVISNMSAIPGANSATITWDTNETASEYVEFGTQIISGKPVYNKIVGSRVFRSSPHTVMLPGDLLPNTTYFFRVRSLDGAGNESISAGSDVTTLPPGFPDTSAPSIFNVAIRGAGTNSMLVTWQTSEPAHSAIEYSKETTDYNLSRVIPGYRTDHAVEVSGIDISSLYRFRIRSADAAGNIATSDNGGSGYIFATLGAASQAPLISNVQVTILDDVATITWTTNESALGMIEYGFDDGYGEELIGSETTSHNIIFPSDILGNVSYKFLVRARASDGREAISREVAVFTSPKTGAAATADDSIPPTISQINVPLVTYDSAVVTWITNEAATTELDYGLSNLYGTSTGAALTLFSQSHSVTLQSLLPGTTYYFRVRGSDAAGNATAENQTTSGDDLKFTTAQAPSVILPPPNPNDTTPPTVTNVQVTETTAKSATITWETDEEGNSLVEYGEKTGVYDNLAGSSSEFGLGHTVTINNLTASTTYYFIATSMDRSANRGVSQEFSFTTFGSEEDAAFDELKKKIELEATEDQIKILTDLLGFSSSTQALINDFLSGIGLLDEDERDRVLALLFRQVKGPARIISEVPSVKVTDTTAEISWETTRETTSVVAYAPAKLYKDGAENPYSAEVAIKDAYTQEHSVTLRELVPNTSYHYQLQGDEQSGKKALSIDRTFKTLPLQLRFDTAKLHKIAEESVTFTWSTNVPAEGSVEYKNLATGEKKSQGDPQFKKSHELVVTELAPRTKYEAVIVAKSEEDQIIRSRLLSFTTGQDSTPPEITQVRTKLSLVAGKTDVVQAVISWNTNELADGQLFYDEGFTKGEIMRQSSSLQSDLTTYHVVVLSKLRPGTVYRFQAVSRDASKNDGPSQEFKIITPRKQESVLELIIKNFEDTFGFLQKINQ